MPLRIVHSNRVEKLMECLAVRLREPPSAANTLEPEIVLLDNPVLGKWINLQLAEAHGIAANIRYVTLSQFFWDLAHEILPGKIPKQTPMSKEEMTWRLLGALQEDDVINHENLGAVRSYLGIPNKDGKSEPASQTKGDLIDLKQYQLAAQIADLFDQYLVFRPEWMSFWDNPAGNRLKKEPPPGPNTAWQKVLWNKLVASAGSCDPRHRAEAHMKLCDKLANEDVTTRHKRLSILGITSMSESQLDMVMGLARHTDIHMYLLNPCEEAWFDILPEKSIAGVIARKSPDEAVHMEIGNPLLAGQGMQVRDFLNILYKKVDEHQIGAQIEDDETFISPDELHKFSLLTAIQQDILELKFRGETAQFESLGGEAFPVPEAESDNPSIHIHNCHSPLREVEVLHDQLLELLNKDKSLNPRDIVVMTPRVGPYVPYIKSVFESTEKHQKIKYHINDRTLQEESPILNSFETLLGLPYSRLPLSEILGLLEVPAIHRRFGLDRNDYEILRKWLIKSGARWGVDAKHREQEVGTAYDEFSWEFAINRMWTGYAMQARDDSMDPGSPILPFDEIEGSQANIFDGFIRFHKTLIETRGSLNKKRSPKEWRNFLQSTLKAFYAPEEDEWRALNKLGQGIDQLQSAVEQEWYGGELSLPVIRAMVKPILKQVSDRRHPWSEGVKFCSLLPMRGVPFKVVYLMGMNMEDYPRRIDAPSFDLMRSDYRPGDRSARRDDRWLFLEALLSARQAFHISFIGQDMHRNEPRDPSVVVSELIDYLHTGFGNQLQGDKWVWTETVFKDGKLAEDSFLYTSHPLQPFSPGYFTTQKSTNRKFSLNRNAWKVAKSQWKTRQSTSEQDSRWDQEYKPPVEPIEIDLDDFVDFLANPPKWFFRQKGVSLNRYEDQVDDEELWKLRDGVGMWQKVDRLMSRVKEHGFQQDGEDEKTALGRVVQELITESRASGNWPLGTNGSKVEEKLNKLKPRFLALAEEEYDHKSFTTDICLTVEGQPAMLSINGTVPVTNLTHLEWSASEAGPKHLLAFYIRTALLLKAADTQPALSESKIVFRNTANPGNPGCYGPKTKTLKLPLSIPHCDYQDKNHNDRLVTQLASLYLAYRETGLPFEARLSLDIHRNVLRDLEEAFGDKWYGTSNSRGLVDDPRDNAYFSSLDAFDEQHFVTTSRDVWSAVYKWLRLEQPQ